MAGPHKRSWGDLTVLSGCIVPLGEVPNAPGVEDAAEDSGSDEDDDGDIQWLDMNEIDDANSGVSVAESRRLANRFVHVKDKSGRVHRVKGRFPLDEPWWEFSVECRASGGNIYLTTGYPEYRLNTNPSIHLILMFLKQCNVPDQYREAFYDAVKTEPLLKGRPLNFESLSEVVELYGTLNETTQAVSEQMLQYIEKQVAGRVVSHALLAPTFLHYGTKLFPSRFFNLFTKHTDRLKVLETVTAQEPWKLGFGPIMYWEHSLIGCEATLDAFKHCNLLEMFPATVKDALYIYDFIKSKCRREGHTYLFEKELHRRSFRGHDIVDRVKAMKFLVDNKVTVQLVGKVALKRYYDYERSIADGIEELLTRDKKGKWVIESDRLEEAFGEDEDQKKAAALICQNPVTVMSGKGGCGKTYVVSKVFHVAHMQIQEEEVAQYEEEKYLNESLNSTSDSLSGQEEFKSSQESAGGEDMDGIHAGTVCAEEMCTCARCVHATEKDEDSTKKESIGQILLTAPTGKAAHLLGKRTGLKAYTLHQVIWSYRHCDKDEIDGWEFRDVRALVVDESSLVSVQTFSTLFKILLSHSCLRKLVLLGDIDQLPSIEPGNFLTDMYHALSSIGWSIKLRTNHRSESKLIVDNATLISQQRLPEFDPERNFHEVRVDREDMLSSAVSNLLKNGRAQDHHTSQFVAFRRKDCNIINEVCCLHYSGHSMKDDRRHTWFRVGDKVCCTKNANVEVLPESYHLGLPANKKAVENYLKPLRLCNGEIFFIKQDRTVEEKKHRTRWITLDDLEREIIVDFRELKGKGGLKHAWARTIHTYQGSESNTVVYVVGTPTRHQNWQHVYTAVTRGKKEVYVVTSSSALSKSVSTLPINRKTLLRGFLLKLLDAMKLAASRGSGGACGQLQTKSFVTALDLYTGGDSGAGSSTEKADGDMGTFTAISKPGKILGEGQGTSGAKAVGADSPFTSPPPVKKRRSSSVNLAKGTPSSNSMNNSEPWSDWGDSFVDEVLEAEVRVSQQDKGKRSSSVVTEHCDLSSANNFGELDDPEFTDSEMWRIGEEEEENAVTTVDLPTTELQEERQFKEESGREDTPLENQRNGFSGKDSPDLFAEPEEIPDSGFETRGQNDHAVTVSQLDMKGMITSPGMCGSPEIPIITIPKTSRLTRIKDFGSSPRKLFADSGKVQTDNSMVPSNFGPTLPSPAVQEGTARGAAEQLSQPAVSPTRRPSAVGNNVTSPKRPLSEEDRTLTPGTPTKVQRTESSNSSFQQSPPTTNMSQLNLQSPARPNRR